MKARVRDSEDTHDMHLPSPWPRNERKCFKFAGVFIRGAHYVTLCGPIRSLVTSAHFM